jgi:hypothetical protein
MPPRCSGVYRGIVKGGWAAVIRGRGVPVVRPFFVCLVFIFINHIGV